MATQETPNLLSWVRILDTVLDTVDNLCYNSSMEITQANIAQVNALAKFLLSSHALVGLTQHGFDLAADYEIVTYYDDKYNETIFKLILKEGKKDRGFIYKQDMK